MSATYGPLVTHVVRLNLVRTIVHGAPYFNAMYSAVNYDSLGRGRGPRVDNDDIYGNVLVETAVTCPFPCTSSYLSIEHDALESNRFCAYHWLAALSVSSEKIFHRNLKSRLFSSTHTSVLYQLDWRSRASGCILIKDLTIS